MGLHDVENRPTHRSHPQKRLLRQYGYPPDMQKPATDTVLQQAEMIANELMAVKG